MLSCPEAFQITCLKSHIWTAHLTASISERKKKMITVNHPRSVWNAQKHCNYSSTKKWNVMFALMAWLSKAAEIRPSTVYVCQSDATSLLQQWIDCLDSIDGQLHRKISNLFSRKSWCPSSCCASLFIITTSTQDAERAGENNYKWVKSHLKYLLI